MNRLLASFMPVFFATVCSAQEPSGKYQSVSTTVNVTGTHWRDTGIQLEIFGQGKRKKAIFYFTNNGDAEGEIKEVLVPVENERSLDFRYTGCILVDGEREKPGACRAVWPFPKRERRGDAVIGHLRCSPSADYRTLRCTYAWPQGDKDYFTLWRVSDFDAENERWLSGLSLVPESTDDPRSVEVAVRNMFPLPRKVVDQVIWQERLFAGSFKQPTPQTGVLQVGVIYQRRKGQTVTANPELTEAELIQHFLVLAGYLRAEEIFFDYSRGEILELALTAYRIGTQAVMEAMQMARRQGIRSPRFKDLVAGGERSLLAQTLPFQYERSPGFARVASYAPEVLKEANFKPVGARK